MVKAIFSARPSVWLLPCALYIAVGRGLSPHGWYGVGGGGHRKSWELTK